MAQGFVELMGNPEWAARRFSPTGSSAASTGTRSRFFLEEWVKQQNVLDLYKKAQARRIPFAPVSTMGDLLSSEHLKKRGFFVEIAHPVAGTHKYPGAPLKYGARHGRFAAGADARAA